MDTRPLQMLSGAEIVDRGRNINKCILPEIGTKEVAPNGSWLETKQIQTALEKRKALIAAERIDKVRALSHAEWRDQLKLAEVTQQVGGHWQYMGHNVNGSLFLLPEEALFLIETNCLLLKHNQVTVSLQKAYSLLLDDTNLIKYKVYASLNRVGYKVFRHDPLKHMPTACKTTESSISEKIDKNSSNTELNENNSNSTDDKFKNDKILNSNTKLLSGVDNVNDDKISTDIKVLANSDMATELPLKSNGGKPTNGSKTLLDEPMPTDTHNESEMAIEMPLAPDNSNNKSDMAVDMPLPANETENISQTDTSLASAVKTNKTDIMAIDAPLTPNALNNNIETTDMAKDMQIPLKDNVNQSETLNIALPTATDIPNKSDMAVNQPPTNNGILCKNSMNSTTSLDITSSTSKTDVANDSDMAIDLPHRSNTASNCLKSLDTNKNDFQNADKEITEHLSTKVSYSIDELGVIRLENKITDIVMKTSLYENADNEKIQSNDSNQKQMLNIYQITKLKIKNRKIQPSDTKSMLQKFHDVPDCYTQQIVTVKIPDEKYLPRNVFLNKQTYEIDLKTLKNMKNNKRPRSNPSIENRAMYRTLRNSSESESAAVPTPEMPQYVPSTPMYQQPYGLFPTWRSHFPRQHFNQHPYFYRMMHFMPSNFNQRPRPPYIRNQYPRNNYQNQYPSHQNNYRNQYPRNYYQQNRNSFRSQYLQRQHEIRQQFLRHQNIVNPYLQSKRQKRRNTKHEHLEAIKNLANKLKAFPTPPPNSLESLTDLITRFNEIYNGKIKITPNLRIYDDSPRNIETIELDDEVRSSESSKYDKYLESVKTLAARLKNMERKNQSASKQKRALHNLLKHFNKAFNADFYIDTKGELKDNKLVVLDSSSDSDVIATDEIQTKNKRRSSDDNNDASKNKKRKLVNPFNILKKVNVGASTSRSDANPDILESCSTDMLKYFDKNWLPSDDDFGKALLCPKLDAQLLFSDSQQLYEFVDDPDACQVSTWIDLKLLFCEHIEAVSNFEQDLTEHSRDFTDESSVKSILVQDPNEDWATSLEKLRIIQTATDVEETSLSIDFDVYNRDVQNFRKTDPPKPHFRIVCVNESSKFPSGAEIAALHGKCDDNVKIAFAVVGIGSISYLQMNPKDLPICDGND